MLLQDCICKAQASIHTLQSPSKPRSPLSDSSSLLIQEENESDTPNPDMSKLKKDKPNKINVHESKEKQTAEAACGISEQTTEKQEEKDSAKHTNTGSAAGSKISASKPRSGAGHRVRAKKTENKASQNRKVTDYYPIRRSNRKTKAELKNEEHSHTDDLIKNNIEEGMQV